MTDLLVPSRAWWASWATHPLTSKGRVCGAMGIGLDGGSVALTCPVAGLRLAKPRKQRVTETHMTKRAVLLELTYRSVKASPSSHSTSPRTARTAFADV